ncbi:helix-turn-helix transcriptional regulator [uncultured Microbacterium sp.]|uniref:PadR family transcriptional regulator n=1 Tax=uncultured Microbacterium sp. TaxID=191216 RepID=UPI0025F0300C|nr:helix-turn-helix transcriptional regulator [uncultured Microbacterium sp.]
MVPLPRATPATADVLDALLAQDEPVWGLRLVESTGRPAGSVYPILERLERLGWVASEWEDDPTRPGPRRRLYTFTPDGAAAAPAAIARGRARAHVVSRPHGATV